MRLPFPPVFGVGWSWSSLAMLVPSSNLIMGFHHDTMETCTKTRPKGDSTDAHAL